MLMGGVSSGELASLQERTVKAEKEAAEFKAFILRVDSLKTSLTAAVNRHSDSFQDKAAASNNDIISMTNPLSQWLGQAREIKNLHADEIHQLKADLKVMDTKLQDAITSLFEDLNSLYYNNFNRQKNNFEGRTGSAESFAEKLSDREEELQEEIDDYDGKIKSFEKKIENKELEISNLQLQLSNNGTAVVEKSCATEKGAINTAVIRAPSKSLQRQ
jgi:chromosome segregation ATPase